MAFYGQFNTDYYISQYFPFHYIGTCLDVGMGEPTNSNNTYHFEQKGWNCVCVEPNPTYCQQAVGVRTKVENIACGNAYGDDIDFSIFTIEGTNQSAISSLRPDNRLIMSHLRLINKIDTIPVKVRTLDYVLEQNPQITSIDFISIDTEDTELDVLKGFDINRWKPKLLVIENNYDEPHLANYLKDFGYVRDKRIEVNDFYVLQ
jgi:FkbM family methyltransferase